MLVPTVKCQILDIWMSNIRALMCGTQHSIFGTQYSGFDIYRVRFPNHFTLQSCYTMNFNTSQWNSGLDRRDSIFNIGVSIVRPRYSGLDPHSSVNYVRIRRTAEVDNVPCETGHPMWAHGYIVDIYTSGPMMMFVPMTDEWAHGVLYRHIV